MENTLTRRNIIRNSIAAATAIALPATAKAETLAGNPPVVTSANALNLIDRMQADMESVRIMEVMGNSYAPHYRQGDLIFVKPATAKATDHVMLRLKSGKLAFGSLVHDDAKAIYLRGFKASDRMQAYPRASIASWGKIVISYRA